MIGSRGARERPALFQSVLTYLWMVLDCSIPFLDTYQTSYVHRMYDLASDMVSIQRGRVYPLLPMNEECRLSWSVIGFDVCSVVFCFQPSAFGFRPVFLGFMKEEYLEGCP